MQDDRTRQCVFSVNSDKGSYLSIPNKLSIYYLSAPKVTIEKKSAECCLLWSKALRCDSVKTIRSDVFISKIFLESFKVFIQTLAFGTTALKLDDISNILFPLSKDRRF